MKHIIVPLFQRQWEEAELIHGLDENELKSKFFLVRMTNREDDVIQKEMSKTAGCFRMGKQAEWYDVLGNVKNYFLKDDFRAQLDLIVDSESTEQAGELFKKLYDTFTELGIMASIRIVFLADLQSSSDKQQTSFLRNMLLDIPENGVSAPAYSWNCFYLLMAEGEESKALRYDMLPWVLRTDCSETLWEIRTCGGSSQHLDTMIIEDIPEDLSRKIVCSLLTRKRAPDPIMLLIMSDGSAIKKETRDRLVILQEKLNKYVPVITASPMDLLVHKGSPDGDMNTREMLAKLYADNPTLDPGVYDKAEKGALEKYPLIWKAADAWEEEVLNQVYKYGDLDPIMDQLKPGSEFDDLLYPTRDILPDPIDRIISEKDGYGENALQKLEAYALNIGNQLQNAVFYARLRLLRQRMPHLREKIREIARERRQATENAMKQNKAESIIRLTERWSFKIQEDLSLKAEQIQMPFAGEDLNKWIYENTRRLLSMMEAPNYEKAKDEMAESIETNMNQVKADSIKMLLALPLSTFAGQKTKEKWIVYNRVKVKAEHLETQEPVLICLQEQYLNMKETELQGLRVFRPKVRPVAPIRDLAPVQEEYADEEDSEEYTGAVERPDEREYEIYTGTLMWIWKNVSWASAKVEAFMEEDFTNPFASPLFTVNVAYKPDDHYDIKGLDKLPSGSLIHFKVTYFERGRPVDSTYEHIIMRAPRTILNVETLFTKEGGKLGLLGRKPYIRLMIHTNGSFSTHHIAVAGSTGFAYTARWEETEGGWKSERLPEGENWHVIDKPGDAMEYEIN